MPHTKNNAGEQIDQSELINMLLASQGSVKKPNNIVINPMVALSALFGIIVILVQIILGVGMWSIKDKLTRYDAYETRITAVETTIIKFDNAIDDLNVLLGDFDKLSNKSTLSEDDGKEIIEMISDNSKLIRELQNNQQRISIRVDNESQKLKDLQEDIKELK